MRSHVRPSLSFQDTPDCLVRNAKVFCQNRRANAFQSLFPNRGNLFGGKFRIDVSFSTLGRGIDVPALGVHVGSVDSLISEKQMRRVTTPRIVARMANVNRSNQRATNRQLLGNPMAIKNGFFPVSNPSVSVAIDGAGPFPALGVIALLHASEKTNNPLGTIEAGNHKPNQYSTRRYKATKMENKCL